jgi:hypothetical protein
MRTIEIGAIIVCAVIGVVIGAFINSISGAVVGGIIGLVVGFVSWLFNKHEESQEETKKILNTVSGITCPKCKSEVYSKSYSKFHPPSLHCKKCSWSKV